MIFEVTYTNAEGQKLQTATFNANSVQEALQHMLTVPSLQPPPGTVDITIRVQR